MKFRWLWLSCLWLIGTVSLCLAQKPPPLRLPSSVVLKMSKDHFEDYCAKRGVPYRDALRYYQTCQLRQNRSRICRLSHGTQEQWWKTREALYHWLDDFYRWREASAGRGTWQLDGWLVARVRCEQGMSQVLHGYSLPPMSRKCSRKIAEQVFSEIKHCVLHSQPAYSEDSKDFLLAQPSLLKSTERLQRYAQLKSPSTQKAIADCVYRVYGEAPD
jgi:hypothetical protein